jgi:hypothetical protein
MALLGAYAVLGLPMDELSEHLLDLYDVLGAEGHRLAGRSHPPGLQRRGCRRVPDPGPLPRLEMGPGSLQ